MEEVIAKMEKDEDMGQLYKQSWISTYAGNQFHPMGVQPPPCIGFVLVTLDCISSSNLLFQKNMSISLTFRTRITKILLIDFGLDIFNMPFCFIYNPVT